MFACFAHPDDEVGALGTLANHGDRGDRVVLARGRLLRPQDLGVLASIHVAHIAVYRRPEKP